MPSELLSRDLLHTRDAIDPSASDEPVEEHAERGDACPILATRSLADTIEHFYEPVAGASVRLIGHRTVSDLQPARLEALNAPGPEVAVMPPGEQHKTLTQPCEPSFSFDRTLRSAPLEACEGEGDRRRGASCPSAGRPQQWRCAPRRIWPPVEPTIALP